MPTYCKIIGGITWYGWCSRLVNLRKSYNLSKITHQIKIENNNTTTGTHLLPQYHVDGSGTEAQCIQSTIHYYIGSQTTDQAHIKYPSRKPWWYVMCLAVVIRTKKESTWHGYRIYVYCNCLLHYQNSSAYLFIFCILCIIEYKMNSYTHTQLPHHMFEWRSLPYSILLLGICKRATKKLYTCNLNKSIIFIDYNATASNDFQVVFRYMYLSLQKLSQRSHSNAAATLQ